jgi:hypothetical protein
MLKALYLIIVVAFIIGSVLGYCFGYEDGFNKKIK